jgi:predicted GIY-YIG superfamily endonuclease
MKTYVYIMCAGGYAKIGVARNPQRRLETMQTGNPYVIKILALFPLNSRAEAFAYESELHNRFREYRYIGEWFHMGGINNAMKEMNRIAEKTGVQMDKKELSKLVFDKATRRYIRQNIDWVACPNRV